MGKATTRPVLRGIVIAIVSDTHRESTHGLRGRTLEAVREGAFTIHAGDFTTEAAHASVMAETSRLEAVHGNSDTAAVVDRLPAVRVLSAGERRVVLTHGHREDETALSLLGRQEAADLVVSGHTHRPRVLTTDAVTLLNPGSPTDPRGTPATHAEFDPETGHGRVVTPDGDVLESFRVPPP